MGAPARRGLVGLASISILLAIAPVSAGAKGSARACGGGFDGTGRAESLIGTEGDDRISGRAGRDTLSGLGGEDCLASGGQPDTIDAGPGPDLVLGSRGNDSVAAADGRRDEIRCGRGRDSVTADRGDLVRNCEEVAYADQDPGDSEPTPQEGGDPVAPALAGCDRYAVPASFDAQVASASDGEVICLADGQYGTWKGTGKAITVRGTTGSLMQFSFGAGDSGFTVDGVQGAQGVIGGGSGITIRNSTFDDELNIQGGSDLLLDGNSHIDVDAGPSEVPGRVFVQTDGVTIRNSLFTGGDADGVHSGSSVTLIGNRFIDVCDGPGANHTDMVQFNADHAGGRIAGNYFFGSANCDTQALTSYDSGTVGMLIEDNVIDVRRPWGIEWYSDRNSIIRHNTVVHHPAAQCDFNLSCGRIEVSRKSHDPAGTGTQVYDNVAVVGVANGSTVARNDHNVSGQGVVYAGAPVDFAGYRLAPWSIGAGAASDGLDVGIR